VVPPFPVKNSIIATGTGDVLSACMILTHGKGEPRERLQLANRIVAEYMSGTLQLIPPL
jgi:pyridoxal/pyridoxine/pyridoxamine kinase